MEKLSLKKIGAIIVGIIALCHLKEILGAFGQIYSWFAESLEPIRDFPEGARAAIAFCTLLCMAVLVNQSFNKKS